MSRFIPVIVLAALAATLAAPAADEPRPKFWIFLTSGKSTAGIPKEEIQAKQEAHLANFRRLAELKLLLAAGPMSDPARVLRGIVVALADDRKQIADYFLPDPYVSGGFMKAEVNRIEEMDGTLTVRLDPAGLEELRIAVWDRERAGGISQEDLAPALEAHTEYWKKQRAAGRLAVRCRFAADAPRFGVAILPAAGDEVLKTWLDEDPLVRQQAVRYQLMPQFLVKGAVSFNR